MASWRGDGPDGARQTGRARLGRSAAEAVPARRRLVCLPDHLKWMPAGVKEVPFGIRPMPLNLARARTLVFEVPRTAKLAYCLARDRRVPLRPKLAVGAMLGLIVSPLNVPAWLPAIGDLDMLALGVLAVRVFIDACPQEVVEEHRVSVLRGRSLFDQDLRVAFAVALDGVGRLSSRRGASLEGTESRESEEQSA